MSGPERSRAARALAERALIRLVQAYGGTPELVLLGGLVPDRSRGKLILAKLLLTASRPVSGVLYPVARAVAIHLRGLPGDIGRAARPLLGLAPGGACRADRVAPAAGALLPHRFTLACALAGHRRSAFCCALLRVAPTGR